MVLMFALALSFVLIAMSYFHYKNEMFDDEAWSNIVSMGWGGR